MHAPLTIRTTVKAPLEKVWNYWNLPEHVSGWTFASDDWQAEGVMNELRIGGSFKTIMSAKDGSASFEMTGIYTIVEDQKRLEYDMEDERHVSVHFEETPDGILVTQAFDPEEEHPLELQQAGWQAILNNFKKYAEDH